MHLRWLPWTLLLVLQGAAGVAQTQVATRTSHGCKSNVAPCAGVATAFAAPIGGLLFTIEEGASFYSTSIFWRGFLSTGIGVFTLHFLVECAVSRLLAPFVPCMQAVHPGGVAHPSL